MSSLYFPALYSTYNSSFELIFFFYFFTLNSSCEAYQAAAAAASSRAAEIVFLTVTADVLQKLFSWETNWAHSDHNLLSGATNYYIQFRFSYEQRKAIRAVELRILIYYSRWYYMFKILVFDWCLSGHITQSFSQLFNHCCASLLQLCFNSASSHAQLSVSPPLASHPDTQHTIQWAIDMQGF